MKKVLITLSLLFIGFIGGSLVGALTGGMGGGVIGVCLYNDIALDKQIVSPEESDKMAQAFAEQITKSDGKLQWLIEHVEIEGAEQCAQFHASIKKEFLKLKAAQ